MFYIIIYFLLSFGQLKGESVIEKYDEHFSEYLMEVLENFRGEMKNGISEIGVPVVDPLSITNIDENIRDELAELTLRMKDIRVVGLSDFSIKELKADLVDGFVNVNLSLPKLHVDGLCYMNGKILTIFPLSSAGNFSIDVQDIEISGKGLFHAYEYQKPDSDQKEIKIRLSDLILDLTFGPLDADFEKVVGGGRWTETLVKILRGNGAGLFQTFHETAMAKLDQILIHIINKELYKFDLNSLFANNEF